MFVDRLLAFFIEHAVTIWLIIGFILIASELMLTPGIGLLFAGLGALTLAALLAFDILQSTQLEWQLILFCSTTLAWTLALWKVVKRYLNTNNDYDMYRGTTAQVQDDLVKGTTGTVRWSGTNMRARIQSDSTEQRIEKGTEVFIHQMKNGLMLVDTQPPQQP